ncbi:MAG: zinc-dependent peptidase [Acidiferrobacterales bacterium]
MFSFITNWWHDRIVKQSQITDTQWTDAFARLPLLDRLTETERKRLRRLAILFLHKKAIHGAHGLVVTDEMALAIALQACLLILYLDIHWFDGWVEIIVYPGGYAATRNLTDEAGVVHQVSNAMLGEAWQRGPVILSWQATASAGDLDGENLVLHEFAHKLDMLTGSANGFPPIHKNMDVDQWTDTFTAAFADFQAKAAAGIDIGINTYGASDPAEFIAVLSEEFFERPQVIHSRYPQVYDLLRQFYRQDPMV